MKVLCFPLALLIALSSCASIVNGLNANDTDEFTYGATDTSGTNNIYGPEQWGNVRCDNPGACAGWPDAYILANNWTIGRNGNTCQWCPEDGSGNCGNHHGSPINLQREIAVENNTLFKNCTDDHWMKPDGGSCTFDRLVETESFTIERHTLKIIQPIEVGTDVTRLDCPADGGRKFAKIDFSNGFPFPWFLSHTDFKVPSEHTQNGARFSAEVQMAHWYSQPNPSVGNEMSHISIFLQAYDSAPPYLTLDRIICQWRRAEERNREACGLPSVFPYPGCFPYSRGRTDAPASVSPKPSFSASPTVAPKVVTATPSKMPIAPSSLPPVVPEVQIPSMDPANSFAPSAASFPSAPVTVAPVANGMPGSVSPSFSPTGITVNSTNSTIQRRHLRRMSAQDVMQENYSNEGEDKKVLEVDPINFQFDERTDKEWNDWIRSMQEDDEVLKNVQDEERQLLEGVTLPFNNYQFLIDARTEYYFRYSGSQTVPPCYGPFTPGTRRNTNHWRILKDPIRVNPRQIIEMERLLKERIAPFDDPLHACKSDTAGIEENGKFSVARPLQAYTAAHYAYFCECRNWPSKWPEDRAWCLIADKNERFFDRPYNFDV